MTSTVTIRGADALPFAHAQFTSNVHALAPGNWQWSAWLDARGRVRFLFHLLRLDETTLVALLRGGDARAMTEALRRFVFRARVTLEAGLPSPLGAGPPLPAQHVAVEGDTLRIGLEERSLAFPAGNGADGSWRLQAIRHGEPWLPDALLSTLLPPALGLRRLGAMSLDKGCFPGQEIAARLHYRGGHKHVLAHLVLQAPIATGPVPLPRAQQAEHVDEETIQVLDCMPAGDAFEVLAVLHERLVARLREAAEPSPAPRLLHTFGA